MRTIFKGITLMCLALTLWSAYAFATHQHSDSVEADNCSVCIAAHSASPVTVAQLTNPTFVLTSVVVPRRSSAKQGPAVLAFSVRPPPGV